MAKTVLNMSDGSSSSSQTSGTNYSAGGEDALKQLLLQLLGGGTAEQRAEAANRATEVQAVRGQRADYTKEAAFTDAQGAMAGESRKALEKLIPSITKAAEGAGTSASSMRALLMQDAANKAAESAAALGLQASVNYGQIGSSLSSVLQSLTAQTNPVTKALLEAIQLSKGQESTGTTSGGSSRATAGANQSGLYTSSPGPSQTGWKDPFLNGAPLIRPPEQGMSGVWGAQPVYTNPNGAFLEGDSLGELLAQGNSNINAKQSSGQSFGSNGWESLTSF